MTEFKRYILAILLILASASAHAQVSLEAQMDSLQIYIGEQTGIHLEVRANKGQVVSFPQYQDTIVTGVEVVETSKIDTQYLNDDKRMVLKETYTITSWDSALYYIPGLKVQVDNEVYESNPLALKVYTVPVDTLHPEAFYGVKDLMEPEFALEDWIMLIVALLLIAPAAYLAWRNYVRIRDNKPIIRKIKVEPKVPCDRVAINAIQKIKNDQSQMKDEPKVYYTKLTDVLRTYMEERFGFNAMEMTSSEILDELKRFGDNEALYMLNDLFQTADLVKFAKLAPELSEKDGNLLTALSFINKTREEANPDAVPQPTEITVVEKPSLRSRIILWTLLGVCLLVLVASLVYIVLQVKDLLFY